MTEIYGPQSTVMRVGALFARSGLDTIDIAKTMGITQAHAHNMLAEWRDEVRHKRAYPFHLPAIHYPGLRAKSCEEASR